MTEKGSIQSPSMDQPSEYSPQIQVDNLLTKELPRRRKEDRSKEDFYHEINTAMGQAISVIKCWIYPFTIFFTLVAVFLGTSLWQSANKAKREMASMSEHANTDYQHLQQSFKLAKSDLSKMQADYQKVVGENDKIRNRASQALNQNQEVLTKFRANIDNLQAFSTDIQKRLGQYEPQINLALKGAEGQRQVAEGLVATLNNSIKALRLASIYNARFLELALQGRNSFPDPNINEEVRMLNKAMQSLGVSEAEYKETTLEKK